MSYEDLEEARAKRAGKEKATASKRERARKLKGHTLDADAISSARKGKAPRVSEMGVKASSMPWTAPVARMC